MATYLPPPQKKAAPGTARGLWDCTKDPAYSSNTMMGLHFFSISETQKPRTGSGTLGHLVESQEPRISPGPFGTVPKGRVSLGILELSKRPEVPTPWRFVYNHTYHIDKVLQTTDTPRPPKKTIGFLPCIKSDFCLNT